MSEKKLRAANMNQTNQIQLVDPLEKWKDIKGYEGQYQVSNFGRVKSMARSIPMTRKGKVHIVKLKEKVMKLSRNNNKDNTYLFVYLHDKSGTNIKEKHYIHRLVAQNFLINLQNHPTVNHKDGIKGNNHLSNLEFASYSDNMQHAVDTKLRKTKLSDDAAIYILENFNKLGAKHLANKYDVHIATIYYVRNGTLKKKATAKYFEQTTLNIPA